MPLETGRSTATRESCVTVENFSVLMCLVVSEDLGVSDVVVDENALPAVVDGTVVETSGHESAFSSLHNYK